ncbi:MAG: NUDIX hydrolase [Planctomycetota bacterium]
MSYTYEYPRAALTVDVVVVAAPVDGRARVLLIRRKGPPFRGAWALPGGFVDIDEDVEAAARRELREETGLAVAKVRLLGVYGAVGRDPRGRTVSVVYLALHPGAPPAAVAGDDASGADWFALARPPSKVAFDHREILRDARRRLAALAERPEDLVRELLPPRLGFDAMLAAFRAALGSKIDRASLRRKLLRRGLLS